MQTYWDGATNRWVTKLPDGTVRAATNAEALDAYSRGAQAPVGSHGPTPPPAPAADPYPLQRFQQARRSSSAGSPTPGTPRPGSTWTRRGIPPGQQGPAVAGPAAPCARLERPQGGRPDLHAGHLFRAGVIPGHGDDYQRQWFDTGSGQPAGEVNTQFYNDPGNWGYAWDKVLNHFGGQVGGDFYKFLQGFSNTARGDFQNSVPYDPNLNVANFLDQYAPQIAGVYKLQPSAQTHGGGAFGLAGRATY
jgi:hypothetical protein